MGCLHSAPRDGEDDYQLGLVHAFPLLSPVDDYGRFTSEVGVTGWVGKYVFDANPDIIKLLKQLGALLGEQTYEHSYPHCWRSKTPVVFRAVEQFFIRIDEITDDVLAAVERVKWLPTWGLPRIYPTAPSAP